MNPSTSPPVGPGPVLGPPEGPMPGRSTSAWVAAAFLPLVVLAALCFIGWRLLAGGEAHAYGSGDDAPATVTLIKGNSYALSVHGGIGALAERGISISSQCSLVSGSTSQPLTLTPYTTADRTVDAVASFVAPVGGSVRILCIGLDRVWVDNSESSDFDLAGLLLLLGTTLAFAAVAIRLYFTYWAPPVSGAPPR